MEKLKNGDKITFPDLPVSFDCGDYDLLNVKGVTKCGNMDAFMINGEVDGQVVSFLVSVPFILDLMGGAHEI